MGQEATVARANFSPEVRRLIADRAGHRCSFPTCSKLTVGPGAAGGETTGDGHAAHIYAASPHGPRGQGGLTAEELVRPENGIWLCATHAKLVDDNRGVRFPPPLLSSYRALHEARVRKEVLGLFSPIGWLHEIRISRSPLFAAGQRAFFSKLNLLYGDNATGKTALCEWLRALFDPGELGRWRQHDTALDLSLSFLNPEPVDIRLEYAGGSALRYWVNGRRVAFNPVHVRFIHVTGLNHFSIADDRKMLSTILRMEPSVVEGLIDEIHAFPHAKVHNLRFVWERECDEDEGEGDEEGRDGCHDGNSSRAPAQDASRVDHAGEKGGLVLRCDVEGTAPGLPLRCLSRREFERVVIEFATAAARVSGRHAPTALILDTGLVLFERWFEFYSHHFLDAENQFQTILCLPTSALDLDRLAWLGWEVLRTTNRQGSRGGAGVVLTQGLRSSAG